MLCCTMPCWWKRKPPKCPFALGFRHPTEGGPSHGHMHHTQKFGKDRACGSGDILAGRQTHRQTDTHRRAHYNTLHRCRGRSNNFSCQCLWCCHHVTAKVHKTQWSWVDFDPRPQHYRSVGTGMGDGLRAGIPPRYVTSNPGQLSLPSSVGRELSTGQRAVMRCGWGVKAGWLIIFMDIRVSGK